MDCTRDQCLHIPMEFIRVCNLRSLADTGQIPMKPITLLVGANSSGKSSFLRIFPLLRQSVETRTGSGLLLNEGYVDFGLFPSAVRKGSDSELKFEFEVTIRPGRYRAMPVNFYLLGPLITRLSVTFAQRTEEKRYAFVKTLRLELGPTDNPDIICLEAAEDGSIKELRINELEAHSEMSAYRLRPGRGIVPTLESAPNSKDQPTLIVTDETVTVTALEKKLLDTVEWMFHGKTYRETRLQILRNLRVGSPSEMLEAMKHVTNMESWNRSVTSLSQDKRGYSTFRNLVLARSLGSILSSISLQLSQFARSIHYFAPVRARVERDYLSRDVLLDSVDPDGRNVAMVLASLNKNFLKSFKDWTTKHFGFSVFPQAVGDGARVALILREEATGSEFNLADTGFGYSQMLPFLVQIWNLTDREELNRKGAFLSPQAIPPSFLLAIEQPELHLHPGLQARLADLFVTTTRVSREKNIPVQFVLETHSPTIIERFGELIEAGQLRKEDVQVLLFEKGKQGDSSVNHAHFDSSGILQDWPYGFLLSHLPVPPDIRNASEPAGIP